MSNKRLLLGRENVRMGYGYLAAYPTRAERITELILMRDKEV